MSIAYIGIGSNIGDKIGYIQQATMLLKDVNEIKFIDSSSLYETEPFGVKDQEWFINAVIKISTTLSPKELLAVCHRIERQLGRIREDDIQKWGPRTVDLDIIFYDDLVISRENLQIPHVGAHMRAFVLVPMLEIDPEYIHPVLNKTISEIHEELSDPEEVYLYGTRIHGL